MSKEKDLSKEIKQLTELIKKLGWNIAIPVGEGKDGMLHGMIIGEESYINYILKHLD